MIDTSGLMTRARAVYAAGNMIQAETVCRSILSVNPFDRKAVILLAFVLARTGRTETALTNLRNALKREPSAQDAQMALSSVLFKADKFDEARQEARTAIDLKPNEPDCHVNFARDLESCGFGEEAASVIANALNAQDVDAVFFRTLGDYLIQSGRLSEVMQARARVVEIDPDPVEGWIELCHALLTAAEFDEAVRCGREAVKRDDDSAEAHFLLGSALAQSGDHSGAAHHVERSLELNPDNAGAIATLGVIRQDQGNFEEGNKLLRRSLELQPAHGFVHYRLLRSRKVTADDRPLLADIKIAAANTDLLPINRSYLEYTLAKSWEDLCEYDKAIASYDKANSLALEHWYGKQPWDRAYYSECCNRMVSNYSRDIIRDLQRGGLDSNLPILIVGMMRSGTTLVEQIVSSHPQVAAGGELDFWERHIPETIDLAGHAPDSSALLRELGGAYLGVLRRFGPDAERVTDKMPHNFSSLGAICSAFPNAHVIHVRRNPIDTCISIYTTAFGHPPPFSLRREDIAYAYREYLGMMSHWRKVLGPEQFHEVNYEELVSDRESVTRSLIEFLGLPWDDACLHYERNERTILTASVWQVRQPIYKSSIGRWERFKPWLSDFADLEELARAVR